MSKLDNYFTGFYNSDMAKKYLELQKDRDLFDAIIDSDHIFDQTTRVDKLLELLSLNRHLLKDKTILNIRPKLAILAIAAIREGAKHVTIVDDSNMTSYIQHLVNKHQLGDRITVIKKSILDKDLKLDKFDVLISDWIGSFGINQGYVNDFIYARDQFVKNDGVVS